MNKTLEIRFERAQLEHADLFLAMMRRLEDADPGTTPFDAHRRRAIFEQFVKDDTFGRAWLIKAGEKPAGYVVLTISFSFEYRGLDAFVDELYVEPAFRKQGIGRRAMEFLEAEARKLGVNAVHLEVSKDNDPALELYRRAGYEDNGRYLRTKWLVPAGG